MELSEYFSRIFPSTAAQMYYPSRKNNGIFVSFCFIEAGSNYFSHKQSDRLKSDDVPLERKLYDGSRKMSQDLKDSFKTFNEDGLRVYFEKIIDKSKYDDVMRAFAIPPTTEKIRRYSEEHLRFSSKPLLIAIRKMLRILWQ